MILNQILIISRAFGQNAREIIPLFHSSPFDYTYLSTGIITLPIFLHNVLLYYLEIIERLSIAFADNGKREIQVEAFLNMRKTA